MHRHTGLTGFSLRHGTIDKETITTAIWIKNFLLEERKTDARVGSIDSRSTMSHDVLPTLGETGIDRSIRVVR